ncbi:MAG: TIGR04283 family arsenosugar biosynthesis glycosyltransferase [Nitrospirota bacterium]
MENKSISVIIPSFNEERRIRACIESARRLNPLEIIVVDGGSTDRTCEIAQEEGAIVIRSSKGRGIQMNKGASFAKCKVLLFLHADTIMPETEISSLCHPELGSGSQGMLKQVQHDIMESLTDKYIGGFFRLKFDDNSLSTRLVEIFANLRARLFSLPYGDQAIFIKRDIFKKIGGFKEYPFLEDIDLVIRARRFGRLKYIPFHVIASSRRLKKGYLLSPIFVSLKNVVIALLFMLGVGPSRLARLYK